MVYKKTILEVFVLLALAYCASAQPAPKACPVRIAHDLHDGLLTSVPRQSKSVSCTLNPISWQETDRTKSSDDRYATISIPTIKRSDCVWLHDFQLNIPDGALINGIRVDFEGHQEGSTLLTTRVQLTGTNGQLIGMNKAAYVRGDDWPQGSQGNDGFWWYGFRDDTWGANLTSDIVNNKNFGLQFQIRKPISRDTSIARLDQVKITVFYSPLYTICHDSCTVFYVDPVPGASKYHWDIPSMSSFLNKDPNSNIINLNVVNLDYGVHEICVKTESGQGMSSRCCMNFRLAECTNSSVGDRLWLDANRNGIQDVSEGGIGGMDVFLMDGFTFQTIGSTVTDSTGGYSFTNVPEGHYFVEFVVPITFVPTLFLEGTENQDSDIDQSNGPNTTRTFYLPPGTNLATIDGGYFTDNTVGDFVWNDADGDGLQGANEVGLADVLVVLKNDVGQIIDSTRSNDAGLYAFNNVGSGDFKVCIESPDNYLATQQGIGTDRNVDSNIDDSGCFAFSLTMGQSDFSLDAGFFKPGKIQGVAWYDRNFDGSRSMQEQLLDEVEVHLLDSDSTTIKTTRTDAFGNYCFDSLSLSNYLISFARVNDLIFTLQDAVQDDLDSDVDINGYSPIIQIQQCDTIQLDAGYFFDCGQISAGGLNYIDPSSPCIGTSPVMLSASPDGTAKLTGGYNLFYILIDLMSGQISATSSDPMFLINDAGVYNILTLANNNSPGNLNFFDIGSIQPGMLLNELIELLEDAQVCYDLDDRGVMYMIMECASVCGRIWSDDDENGLREIPEGPADSAFVSLLNAGGSVLATSNIDQQGRYTFDNLVPASYRIRIRIDSNYNFSPQDVGVDDSIDSDVNPFGESALANLSGGDKYVVDAGIFKSCQLNLGYIDNARSSIDCWSGSSYIITADLLGAGTYPVGFASYFLLSKNGWIEEISNSPDFTTDTFGIFCIHEIIVDTNKMSPDYIDVDELANGTWTPDDVFDLVFFGGLCAIFDIDGLCLQVEECASVGDYIWEDANGNGIQEGVELGLNNVRVELFNLRDSLIDFKFSSPNNGENGYFLFERLIPGDYYLRFETPTSMSQTLSDQIGDDLDSDVTNANGPGTTDLFFLSSGQVDLSRDAGFKPDNSVIGDFVWEDRDGNGIQENDEAGLNDIKVELYNNFNQLIGTTNSSDLGNGDGEYKFVDVQPGAYYIKIDTGSGYIPTLPNQGGSNEDSDIDGGRGAGTSSIFVVGQNQVIDSIDIGLVQTANMGDFVWWDYNNNGIQDTLESGVDSVIVTLKDTNGLVLDKDTTDIDGEYGFQDLLPGYYFVEMQAPDGFTSTLANSGNDRESDSNLDDVNGPLTTADFLIESGVDDFSIDLGITNASCIGDYIWQDLAFNGIQDFFERGINGVLVELFNDKDSLIQTTMSANSPSGQTGYYSFSGVQPGSYYLKFSATSEFCPTLPLQGGDRAVDSDLTNLFGEGTTDIFQVNLGDSLKHLDAGFIEKAKVGDFVWEDSNSDGLQDANEQGINGVRVFLYDEFGLRIDSTTTADRPGTVIPGFYQFVDLTPGSYYLQFGDVPGLVFTMANAGNDESLDSDVDNANGFGTTAIISLSPGEDESDVDAGYSDPMSVMASIGDYIWLDRDNDGVQDRFENGLNGVEVSVYDKDYQLIRSVVSSNHPTDFVPGYYEFDSLIVGEYFLVFTPPLNHEFAISFAGFNEDQDSDISHVMSYGSTNILPLYGGEQKMGIDAGFIQIGSLGDFVWDDTDANGIQDPGERGMNDIKVWLYDEYDELLDSTFTTNDANGNPGYYLFDEIPPSGFYLKFDLPSGYIFTPPNEGGDDTRDSDVNEVNGEGTTAIINISPGEHDRDADAGIYKTGMVGHRVWKDDNFNGIQDFGEEGMPDIEVALLNANDSLIYYTYTDEFGAYMIEDIPMGSYYVRFDPPSDFSFTSANTGSDDKMDSDVTHFRGYGSTSLMEVYPGDEEMYLDAGMVESFILAIDFEKFEAVPTPFGNDLKWRISNETHVKSYVVERIVANSSLFEAVDTIQVDKTQEFDRYYFDPILNGDQGYRIKAVLYSGAWIYSPIRYTEGQSGSHSLNVYPNPASINLNVDLPAFDNFHASLTLHDFHQHVVWSGRSSGKQLIEIDVSSIPAGTYILSVLTSTGVERKTITILE